MSSRSNTALIPRYASVYPALKRLPQNVDDGKVVGVPHGRGADVLIWRTDRVRRAPTGWGVLFGSRYAGRIGLYDAAITLADTAIQLGFRNPYELDAKQFRAVVRLAAEQKASVGVYWQDLTNALADYTGGNALVGEATPRLAALLRADEVPVRTAVPAGGTARSVSLARARTGRDTPAACTAGSTTSCRRRRTRPPRVSSARRRATPAACAYMGCRAVHAGDEAWWSRLSFWRTPQRDCHDARGARCADWFEWSDAWAQIRSG